MAVTVDQFFPENAHFPVASATPAPANYNTVNATDQRPVIEFDASVDEQCYWTGIARQDFPSTTLTLIVQAIVQATSGNIMIGAQVEAISDTDAVDLDATNHFDTANAASAQSVPATAGHIKYFAVVLTNKDTIAPGDYYRLRLYRDADNGSDTAAGLLQVLACEIQAA